MAQQQQLTIAEEQEILTTDWTPERLKALPLERVLRFSSHPRLAEALLVCHGRRPLIMKDGFDLYPHQIRVVKWMGSTESHSSSEHWRIQNWNAKGGIIHLAMGLGKSLIALVHILSSPRGPFPSLLVASKAVMAEWKHEVVEKFLRPEDQGRVLFLHKDFMDRQTLRTIGRAELAAYDLVITSYDLCVSAFREGDHVKDILVKNETTHGCWMWCAAAACKLTAPR